MTIHCCMLTLHLFWNLRDHLLSEFALRTQNGGYENKADQTVGTNTCLYWLVCMSSVLTFQGNPKFTSGLVIHKISVSFILL